MSERGVHLKQKKSVEDYLKTIYVLARKKDVHGADIAKEIGVSRSTVCVSLKALTEKGMRIAKETYERHNTFCRLLTGLGVDEKTVAGSLSGRMKIGLMEFSGFKVFHKWTPEGYLDFLKANGYEITCRKTYDVGLKLTYVETRVKP